MIIAQTPFRISLFGGGTDYPEFFNENRGSVISGSINKYCYVTVRHLPPFFDYTTELSYSTIERVNDVNEIQHPAIREAMNYYKMKEIRLTYEADLPARSGLGTSSSFAVGMVHTFNALKGKFMDKKLLAEQAILIERNLCREEGGWQDQIAASYGGFNRIDFKNMNFGVNPVIISIDRKKELSENLLLFFSGFSRFSYEIASNQLNAITNKKKELNEMLLLVDEAQKIMTEKSKPLDEIGKLLHYTWLLKRGLTNVISNGQIDMIYQKALKAGAIGGKLLGAGGGGFLVFYVEKEKQEDVKKALKDLLYVPFEFEESGSKIIHYVPERYNL